MKEYFLNDSDAVIESLLAIEDYPVDEEIELLQARFQHQEIEFLLGYKEKRKNLIKSS